MTGTNTSIALMFLHSLRRMLLGFETQGAALNDYGRPGSPQNSSMSRSPMRRCGQPVSHALAKPMRRGMITPFRGSAVAPPDPGAPRPAWRRTDAPASLSASRRDLRCLPRPDGGRGGLRSPQREADAGAENGEGDPRRPCRRERLPPHQIGDETLRADEHEQRPRAHASGRRSGAGSPPARNSLTLSRRRSWVRGQDLDYGEQWLR